MTRFFDDIIRDERKDAVASVLKVFLWIASLIYSFGVRMVNAGYDLKIFPVNKLPKPVVCIGNITVGGSGKTPLVIALAKQLQSEGFRVAVLTRGYRSKNNQEGNDEVLMMNEVCPDIPVIVGRNRYETAMQFLFGHEVDVFLMDDGFQHRRLARDLDIVAVESLRGFGNRQMLPRGILREPLSGLKRADMIVLAKTDLNPVGEKIIREILSLRKISKPVITSRQKPIGLTHLRNDAADPVSWLIGKKVFVLTSIADPKGFERTLARQGAEVAGKMFFPDHYVYEAEDVVNVAGAVRARSLNIVVTTHKDAVKLEPLVKIFKGIDVVVLNIETEIIDHENILMERLHSLLRS